MAHDSKKYKVGYKKPPERTRFKKGQSGNPKGRPLGSKNMHGNRLENIVMQEVYRLIPVNEGGKQARMPLLQAMMRSMGISALKGQVRTQRTILDLVREKERNDQRLHEEYLRTMMEYKYHWETIIEECRLQKRPIPEPLPHPNDILIDVRTGEARIMGPMTPEEKKEWDALRACKADYIASIQRDAQFLLDHPECPDKQDILDAISRTQKTLDKIRRLIPD